MTEPLTPIAEPITGREDPGDLSRPEQALAQFYRGLNGRLFAEFHDYPIHRSDSIFYAVGRERGRFERGSVGLDLAIEDPTLLGVYRQAVSPAAR